MYFKTGLHRKMMTRKIGCGILNEIKELGLVYMEHDYMHIKGQKRGHVTSRNLKVLVNIQLVLFGLVQIVKGNFMSLGLVYFPHSFNNVDT